MTKNLTNCRLQLKITGIVQGVGFRPFVYRLAHELNLTGNVLNNSEGVTIEAQGHPAELALFEAAFRKQPPPLARIDSIEVTPLPIMDDCGLFSIVHSEKESLAVVAVSSDKCTCDDCFNDIANINDRHFRYPFTNCTNCGPRYSLINALPYDRPNTAMADFDMCPECKSAYLDPMDRRYHAQPVSCPDCGPQLSFKQADLTLVSSKESALEDAIEALLNGKILAIKGIGGFHLVCDATNDSCVSLMRQRKSRPAKPFAVMVENIEAAKKLVTGSTAEWQVLSSAERPITLMRKIDAHNVEPSLSQLVAPRIDRLGIFLPYTPLHQLLLNGVKRPLVMTSANLSGEPIITDSVAINSKLSHVIDNILDHNRPILNGCDDSVVQVINDNLQVLRLARGYAPLSFYSEQALNESILAVGAQQKNSICFGFNHNLFLSPHIGDLVSIEAEEYFHHTLNTFSRLYGFDANCLIHDNHPDYATSRWAQSQDVKRTAAIQHHYAHVLSVMAANKITTPVLGFSFDGTGLGDDKTLWGGELLSCDVHKYQRLCHLSTFALIGGEQAIKQPVRLLLAILLEKYSPEQIKLLDIPALKTLSPTMFNNLVKLWQAKTSIKTSSIGRLFDAVAVALGMISDTQYEGEAGILIETAANSVNTIYKPNFFESHSKLQPLHSKARETIAEHDESIRFVIKLTNGQWDSSDLLCQIVEQMTLKPPTPQRVALISKAFMDALCDMVCQSVKAHLETPIVLCGGVFQNRYLLERCEKQLTAQGNQLLSSHKVPINDAGIALGQLWYAMHNKHV
ncbi:carbamoyltransferase HypF [Shewanella schlegeliana]|uniref:Carbamoyltransferase HypF n=1 Tax=Shewanella schlegeliana TaxID=190308 RepID=A0ABS1SZ76_9GAMM|nr:carbamoyltransferase HypF [Shewanella schlegeliana]MBL4913846.1 carbamoyltransferase HypF [Shewanella schlegeliana]MCL1108770.1 carbamoyltransferase HypF [Shewanella schlegeliana]GIU26105.1 carbamoyltransferase HypF [Shewanella schlegeliana]